MSSVFSRTSHCRQLEFSGHLIDSLTLAKVIDLIEHLGGDYDINEIHIGARKHDISSLNLTVYADNPEKLDELVNALLPHGAVPVAAQSVGLTTVQTAGEVPGDAFQIKFPNRVHLEGGWIELQRHDPIVIVVDPVQKTGRLAHISEVPAGAQVVSSTHGIEW